MITFKGKYTNAKVMIDEIDEATAGQIVSFINHPVFTNPVAVMPDTHYGKGAVIGFTMEMTDCIIPNIVGVDESCGVRTTRLGPGTLNGINLEYLDNQIRELIPMSKVVHNKPVLNMEREFDWKNMQKDAAIFTSKFNERYSTDFRCPIMDYGWFTKLCECTGTEVNYAQCSIGTLGGGNHYIEIGKDEKDYIWVTIHSGSRNLGYRTASFWQRYANREVMYKEKNDGMKHIKETFPKEQWQEKLIEFRNKEKVHKGLEYLRGKDMFGYLIDSIFAHWYADRNRVEMARIIAKLLGNPAPIEFVTSVHNYIDCNDFIIRKGAVPSYKNHRMIIPFNMEDGMLICEGKSNKEWNYSAPHGAGRVGSRTWAKENLDVDQARKSMKECGIFSSVLPTDELKGAYKSSEKIEEAIGPTAKIIHRVKPIMNIKAG